MKYLISILGQIFIKVNKQNTGIQKRQLTDKQPLTMVGNVDPNCPYCGNALAKKPGAKTKCPFCGSYIYVRTRPIDKKQVLVTKDEIEIVEEEWSIVNGTHTQFLFGKKERESIKAELTNKFGHPPVPEDIEWVRLNRQLSEEAQNNCWGAYTSTRLQMAEELRKRKKYDHALRTYLEVCYLNLNGPQNCTIYAYNVNTPRKEHRFIPKNGKLFIEIDRVLTILKKLNIQILDLKDMFFEIAVNQQNNLKLPLAPEKAWALLYDSLRNDGTRD